MPDITMCKGGHCMLRLSCHRYTAKADELAQSYFTEPPYKVSMMLDDNEKSLGVVTLSCAYFWNNVEERDEKAKD